MNKIKTRHYKNQLSSYEYWLSELTEINNELKAIKRIIEEPKATQFGEKEMNVFSDDQLFKYHGILEKEIQLKNRREFIEYSLESCVRLLASCEDDVSTMLYGLYIKDLNGDRVANHVGYSRMSMYRRIEKSLNQI